MRYMLLPVGKVGIKAAWAGDMQDGLPARNSKVTEDYRINPAVSFPGPSEKRLFDSPREDSTKEENM